MFALKRLPRIGPFQLRFDRTLRGAAKSRAKSVALGASLAKTLPVLPSAHRDGIVDGSAAYADQSGVGTAAPTQVSCCSAPASPALSIAVPMEVAAGRPWKTPMPPRTTARRPRMAPSKPAMVGAGP